MSKMDTDSIPHSFIWTICSILIVNLLWYIYKHYIIKAVMCKSQVCLNGKVVVITGCNTGIGLETARDMASRGARVLMACRDLRKGKEAMSDIQKTTGNYNIQVLRLDLASLESVRQCANAIIEEEKHLDILINNAGVLGAPYSKTREGFELTFGVNHLGHFLFTNLLLNKLVECAPSRIVNVSGHAHLFSRLDLDNLIMSEEDYSSVSAYCQSKLANIMFTRQLASRMEGTGVNSYSVHPGVIHSGLARHFFFMRAPMLKEIGDWVQQNLLKTVVEGSQTTIHCAVADEVEEESGGYYSNCSLSTPSMEALNEAKAERLWEISAELVGLENSWPLPPADDDPEDDIATDPPSNNSDIVTSQSLG